MTDSLKKSAQKLAAKGRYGDSMLLHVSPAEVQGLASLIPGGKLPVNPHTGLPEAFFFLPFLASLFGAAAPAAAAATAAAPALGAAAGGALASGAGAAAGLSSALGAGATGTGLTGLLGSIGSGISSGVGALAKGIGSLGSSLFGTAAPAALPAASAAPAAIAPTTALAVPATTSSASPLATALSAAPVAPATAATGIEAALPGLANPAGQSYAGAGTATLGPARPDAWAGLRTATAPSAAPAAQASTFFPPAPAPPGAGGLGGLLGKLPGGILPWAMGAQMLGGLMKGGGGGGGKKEKEDDVDDYQYEGGEPSFPDESYEPGISDEWDYFPKKVRGYAQGGIVGLEGGDLQAQMPHDMTFPQNGIGSLVSPEQIPESPFPSSQVGSEPEPSSDEIQVPTDNDKELIAQAVEAIKGTIPNPEQVILAFVKEFGEPAFQDLVQRVQAMPTSDGQSDSIPALINGQEPAALSEGEYVVPADVVSGMGNGSTDAGAKQLDSLIGNVRQTRTGSAKQPPAYAGGGLVSLLR